MDFSLICGTAGRTLELERMIRSLVEQTYGNFELLLVDQNGDQRVQRIVASLPRDTNVRVLASSPGFCRAVNLGLEHAQGEVIGFPDDDCWYPKDLLANLKGLFDSHPGWDGITTPTADEKGLPSIARWSRHEGRIFKSNIGMRGCSTSIFYRRKVCERIGKFDETVGAIAGLANPGADMDYLHRVIRSGFHMRYRPELVIGHPQTLAIADLDEEAIHKRYYYGFGEGSIARRYGVPLWYAIAIVVFPLCRSIGDALLGRKREATLQWVTAKGRMHGWLSSKLLPPTRSRSSSSSEHA